MGGIVADRLNYGLMNDTLFNPSGAFTLLFAVALIANLLLKFWLASRQIRHVARHRSAVPPAFSESIALDAHQKAADYTIAKTQLGFFELAWGAATVLGWTLLGGLSALNQGLHHWIAPGLIQQVSLLVAFTVINGLIDLPFGLYGTFVLEERFGFNKTTPKQWVKDLFQSTALGLLIGAPLAALVVWMMGASGPAWWIWTWGIWVAFNALAMWVSPTWIAPLFNKFDPLKDESLKLRVSELMQRCGFQAQGFYVMDGSKRSAHANAYFTGFGSSKRVVFYDTLLERLSPAEIDAVLAHEIGHFKHRHILKRLASAFVMSLLGFAVLGWFSTQAWFYTGLGVAPNMLIANDALALVLFLIALPLFTGFLGPLFAQISRQHEFEADHYAIDKTNAGDLASALLKLYQDNASTLTPDPLYVKFYYSHPPASERLGRMQMTAVT